MLFFVDLEHRSQDFATFVFEQYFSIAHYRVARLPRTAAEITFVSFVCFVVKQLPILQVRRRLLLLVGSILGLAARQIEASNTNTKRHVSTSITLTQHGAFGRENPQLAASASAASSMSVISPQPPLRKNAWANSCAMT